MFKESRKRYDSNGFLLQYKKRLQRTLISPKLLYNMLKKDIQEHSIGPVRFWFFAVKIITKF